MSDLRDDEGITAAAFAVLNRLGSTANPVSGTPEASPHPRKIRRRRDDEIIPGLSADAERGRNLANAFKGLSGYHRSAYLAEYFPGEGRRSSEPAGQKGLPAQAIAMMGKQTGFSKEQINAGMAVYDATDLHDRNHEILRIDFWERMGKDIAAAANPAAADTVALVTGLGFTDLVNELKGRGEQKPAGRSNGLPRSVVPAGRQNVL